MKKIAYLFIALGFSAHANAGMVEKKIAYKIGQTPFESTLVYDDATTDARPALLLVPNWFGANQAAIAKAKQIAKGNYVILVADVYGKTVRPKNKEEAGAAAKDSYSDRARLRVRAQKALDMLKAQASKAPIAAGQFGAIGFCFGGATVLELARSNADIAGAVSFHGNLATDMPAQAELRPAILAINGADDSYVASKDIESFQREMAAAKADWQFVNLGGAVHCFAEPDANDPPGCLYNENAANRAFEYMHGFFARAFGAH